MMTEQVEIRAAVSWDDKKVTIAEVVLNEGDFDERGESGSAIRVDPDQFNTGVGYKLALGRALRDLGRAMIREGRKEIQCKED